MKLTLTLAALLLAPVAAHCADADTFGPVVSFARTLKGKIPANIAIAKLTHSGSQMNDWSPQGTSAKDRLQARILPQAGCKRQNSAGPRTPSRKANDLHDTTHFSPASHCQAANPCQR